MGWRRDESWFDPEWPWLQEPTHGGAGSLELNAPAFFDLDPATLVEAIPNGLAESRRRRAELRQRRDTRKTRTAALVIGPAVMMAVAAPKLGGTSRANEPLAQDPPSQMHATGRDGLGPSKSRERTSSIPAIHWHRAASHGLPYAGSLHDGTQLPIEGPDWVTWNPVEDRVPNSQNRLYGNDRVIRTLLAVIAAFRSESPDAPRVLVGDISFRHGGPMEQHRSHQNGLDVDIYYPRRDRRRRPPASASQIDRKLTQDLVDRFVAAGAEKVFVGYAAGLRGPRGVVVPYPNHGDHMHVRFNNPKG